jgi:lipoprotein-releasing system ATP-binding protein
MIIAKNIHKKYDNLHVLKGVNLHIKKGEIVSIVGSSGTGKTTLLQILGTLDFIDQKEINTSLLINDVAVNTLKEKNLAKFRNENIGFIFQFHQLLPEFTALENVCIPAYIGGKEKNVTEKKSKGLT